MDKNAALMTLSQTLNTRRWTNTEDTKMRAVCLLAALVLAAITAPAQAQTKVRIGKPGLLGLVNTSIIGMKLTFSPKAVRSAAAL